MPREPMLPLQPAGKLVTLDEFLVHCNIDVADAMCQTLFKGHDVKHWSFFRGKSDEDLMPIGFTRGLATHLSNGASDVDRSHSVNRSHSIDRSHSVDCSHSVMITKL
ncbi:hypothetical protein PGT21_005765 [Puccinia graminis f. sp. tritici]|uniref:Uncharacterized protein n=1 Tax=Puccinia graminis f. sp. tritici TaxID=56615 RepID=A0A5B0NPZ4_PUCGR|nr:hypothetical protein PGT21_005765 [Puccinia graminis f. sp. tritici]